MARAPGKVWVVDRASRKVCIWMANEPRSYRESIAEVFRILRPEAEVTTVEPETLDHNLSNHTPDMVVCNEATSSVRGKVPVWVELYPGHGSLSVVSVEGERQEIEDIQLSDLLHVVDRSESIVRRKLAQPG